jgi:RHS repeat-associated protein
LSDALGTTVTLADSSGTAQTEYSYEPFGATTASGTASGNELRYTGREDDGTGVYYYRARYYHPQLQRFISEDPIGFAGGDPNLYAYVMNAPTRFTDPLGLRYLDVNLSFGNVLGVTLGVAVNNCGIFPYLGGGAMIGPPGSGALTYSPSDPTIGWNSGIQGQYGYAYQWGKDRDGNKFEEWGIGSPGISVTNYYVFRPWVGPMPWALVPGANGVCPTTGRKPQETEGPPEFPPFVMP